MTPKIQREIGIIANYLTLLLGAIFLDWKAFNLMLSFIIEYTALLFVYLYVSRSPGNNFFSRIFTSFSHLTGGLALGFVQGFFIMLMAGSIDGEISFDQSVRELPWLIPAIAVPMLIFQFIAIKGRKGGPDLQAEKMAELIFSAVVFPAILLGGLLAYQWSDENTDAAIITIASVRIALEIWSNHLRKTPVGSSTTKKQAFTKSTVRR